MRGSKKFFCGSFLSAIWPNSSVAHFWAHFGQIVAHFDAILLVTLITFSFNSLKLRWFQLSRSACMTLTSVMEKSEFLIFIWILNWTDERNKARKIWPVVLNIGKNRFQKIFVAETARPWSCRQWLGLSCCNIGRRKNSEIIFFINNSTG